MRAAPFICPEGWGERFELPGLRAIALGGMVLAMVAGPALAQTSSSQHRTDLLDLKLGTAAKDLPEEAFIDYACGTDGGPPGVAVGSFTDFAKCPAEPSGLHEIAFRYDDELEYRLLAQGLDNTAELNGGTKVSNYPVFASALFDDNGVLRGLRAVTDGRIALRDRTNAHLMADAVQIQFGKANFTCIDNQPANGEEPLAGSYINQQCTQTVDGELVYTEEHFFRRNGEQEVNPITGRVQQGFFDSSARLEIREPGARLDPNGRPL